MITQPTTHRAFGLAMQCHFPLPELPVAPAGTVDVELQLASERDVHGEFSGTCDPPAIHVGTLGDGDSLRIERGVDSDYRVELADQASFLLTGDGRRLYCAPKDAGAPSWRRFLLDTVLTTVALVHGYEAFHAAAFERDGHAIAVVGDEGAGKSTLLAEMLGRGARFVCDDVLCVGRDQVSNRFVAFPGPPVMNLAPVLPDGTPAARLGPVLASFDDECWLSVEHAAVEPCTISAFVQLRRDRAGLAVERLEPSPTLLLRHSLGSGRTPDRLRHRFSVCSDLASDAALFRISAASDDPAGEVAGALEAALAAALAASSPSTGSLTR